MTMTREARRELEHAPLTRGVRSECSCDKIPFVKYSQSLVLCDHCKRENEHMRKMLRELGRLERSLYKRRMHYFATAIESSALWMVRHRERFAIPSSDDLAYMDKMMLDTYPTICEEYRYARLKFSKNCPINPRDTSRMNRGRKKRRKEVAA